MTLTKNSYEKEISTSQAANAVALMKKGFMCSGAVLMAYADRFGLEEDLVRRITGGFAGGMAQGKTCGALSGATMVLGLRYGMGIKSNQYAKELCFQMTQELFHRFERYFQTSECHQIQRNNHINPEDPELSLKLRKSGICLTIVQNTIGILEDLFGEENI